MNNLPLPALLAVRHKEEEAFKRALKTDKLSEISVSDNYIEDYEYIGSCQEFHWFRNIFGGNALKCPK